MQKLSLVIWSSSNHKATRRLQQITEDLEENILRMHLIGTKSFKCKSRELKLDLRFVVDFVCDWDLMMCE